MGTDSQLSSKVAAKKKKKQFLDNINFLLNLKYIHEIFGEKSLFVLQKIWLHQDRQIMHLLVHC